MDISLKAPKRTKRSLKRAREWEENWRANSLVTNLLKEAREDKNTSRNLRDDKWNPWLKSGEIYITILLDWSSWQKYSLKTLGRTSLSHLKVTRAYEALVVCFKSLSLHFISCKSVRGLCAKGANFHPPPTIKRPLRHNLGVLDFRLN